MLAEVIKNFFNDLSYQYIEMKEIKYLNKHFQVAQLDKLEQFTNPATKGVTGEDGELGELSQKFYQAAIKVCVW